MHKASVTAGESEASRWEGVCPRHPRVRGAGGAESQPPRCPPDAPSCLPAASSGPLPPYGLRPCVPHSPGGWHRGRGSRTAARGWTPGSWAQGRPCSRARQEGAQGTEQSGRLPGGRCPPPPSWRKGSISGAGRGVSGELGQASVMPGRAMTGGRTAARRLPEAASAGCAAGTQAPTRTRPAMDARGPCFAFLMTEHRARYRQPVSHENTRPFADAGPGRARAPQCHQCPSPAAEWGLSLLTKGVSSRRISSCLRWQQDGSFRDKCRFIKCKAGAAVLVFSGRPPTPHPPQLPSASWVPPPTAGGAGTREPHGLPRPGGWPGPRLLRPPWARAGSGPTPPSPACTHFSSNPSTCQGAPGPEHGRRSWEPPPKYTGRL